MESHWDTLPPEMHKKILFWKEVAELRKRKNVKRHRWVKMGGTLWHSVQKLALRMARKALGRRGNPIKNRNLHGWAGIQTLGFLPDTGFERQKKIQKRISQTGQDRKKLFWWSKMPRKRVRDRIFRVLGISLIARIERQHIREQEHQCQQKSTRLVFTERWTGKSQKTLVRWGPWVAHLGAFGYKA